MPEPPAPGADLPPALADRLRRELVTRERLVWAARPLRGPRRAAGCMFMLLGAPLAAFGVFFLVGAMALVALLAAEGEWFGVLGVLVMWAPGAALTMWLPTLMFRFAREPRRCVYALTDRRAVVLTIGACGEVSARSFGPAGVARMHRVEYPDGSGCLLFERFVALGSPPRLLVRRLDAATSDADAAALGQIERRGFLEIAAVREVEHLVRNTLLPS